MKTLSQYLQDTNTAPAEFARELALKLQKSDEACAVMVSRITNHNHRPSPEAVVAIYELTQKAVEPNDFYDLQPSEVSA